MDVFITHLQCQYNFHFVMSKTLTNVAVLSWVLLGTLARWMSARKGESIEGCENKNAARLYLRN